MAPIRPDLLARWCSLLTRCRRTFAPGDPARGGDDLLGRWAEPHRRYHTTDHLAAVLDHAEELAPNAGNLDAVLLAVWFHDAVYQLDRSDNEEQSALLAERVLLEVGVGRELTAEVARLVRLTVDHAPDTDDRNGQVVCDADLAVLGGNPQDYAQYAASVRAEYAFVPDDAFRAGRAEVLRHLLTLPHLYRTPQGNARWTDAARRNLAAELQDCGELARGCDLGGSRQPDNVINTKRCPSYDTIAGLRHTKIAVPGNRAPRSGDH